VTQSKSRAQMLAETNSNVEGNE